MRRVLIALLVVGALAAVSYWGYQQATEADTSAQVQGEQIPIVRGAISATVNATGSVAPRRQVTLTFRAAGRVQEILVAEGQEVREGEALARLDTTDLQFAIDQAQANLASAEAQARLLEDPPRPGDIETAEAQVRSAQENLARVQTGASAADLNAARAQLTAAQASLDVLLAGPDQAALRGAQAEIARAEAALKQAQAAYDQVKWRNDIGALPESLQLESATITYQVAKANYDAVVAGPSQDQIDQAKSQVAQAQANLARLTQPPSSADVAAAEAQVVQAQTALDALQEGPNTNQIASAEASVRQAEISLEQARINLEGAVIEAPFGGTIAELGAQETELVTAATPIVILVDLENFYIDVQVDEIDVGRVEAGDHVTITLDAYREQPFLGTIERIAPIATTTAQGVVSYPVRITLDPESIPVALRSGLTANVTITTEQRDDVILVPNRAIAIDRSTGEAYVEKLNPLTNQTQRQVLSLGLRNEIMSEVRAGLETGDIVVIPSNDLNDRFRLGG